MKPYYEHAGITIYHGDCREILPTLPLVDLCLTDPPYGILNLHDGSSSAIRKSPRSLGSGKLKDRILNRSEITWDIAPDGQLLAILLTCATTQIIWGGNYFPLPPVRGFLIWDKQQPWENFSQVEFAWTSMNRPSALFRLDKGCEDKQHPTQKPVNLMKWCLGFAPDAKTMVDPFCGSGSSLVAAKARGMEAIGIEIEERYCEIAARRLSQEVFDFSASVEA